jgi:hypothetical protein
VDLLYLKLLTLSMSELLRPELKSRTNCSRSNLIWKPPFMGEFVVSSKCFAWVSCPSSWLRGLSLSSTNYFFCFVFFRLFFFFLGCSTFSSKLICLMVFCSTRYPTYTLSILFSTITLRMYSKSSHDYMRFGSKLLMRIDSSLMYKVSVESLRKGELLRKPLRIYLQMFTRFITNSCLKLSAFLISCC